MTDGAGSDDAARAYYESAGPAPGDDPFAGIVELPAWDGPSVLLRDALTHVQRDLDAAGLNRYRMSYAVAGGTQDWPVVNVQFRGTWTSDGIDIEAVDLASALLDVAAQAAQCLVELEGVYWPVCPSHSCWATAAVASGAAVWTCGSGGRRHPLAGIGELRQLPEAGRSQSLWRTLAGLAPP